jgi:hypothetical protein
MNCVLPTPGLGDSQTSPFVFFHYATRRNFLHDSGGDDYMPKNKVEQYIKGVSTTEVLSHMDFMSGI